MTPKLPTGYEMAADAHAPRLEHLRSSDTRALWPGLSTSALVDARRRIEQVVRRVLAGESAVPLHGEDRDRYALGVGAHTSGTGALLARWIEDGRVLAEPAAAATLAPHLEHGRKRAERVRREVIPALDALLAREIVPVVIKGLHTALAYCEEPGVRPMADVDIVVPLTQATQAEAALRAARFILVARTRHAPKSDWIAADIDPRVFSVERPDARNRWRLELHESFDRDFAGVFIARLDGERERVAPLSVGGRSVLAPAQPLLLLVLACQASSELDSMRLMRLIDIVRVVRADRSRGALDWNEILAALRRTGAGRFAYPAFALAEDLAPGTIDPSVLEAARSAASWAMRRAVARLAPSGGVPSRPSIVRALMWADNPPQVVSGLVGVLMRKLRG